MSKRPVKKHGDREEAGASFRNILANMGLEAASGPKELLNSAAAALKRNRFVDSVRAYVLRENRLISVSRGRPPEELPLSRGDHPAVRALYEEYLSARRDDGHVDIAACVGGGPVPTGVLHVVLNREDKDSELLTRRVLAAVSSRLRMLEAGLRREVASGETRVAPADEGDSLASLIHEVSNPLAAMSARLEALRMDRGDDPVVKGHIDVLMAQVARLSGILDRARSSMRGLPRDRGAALDVGEGLREVVELVRDYYRSAGVEIELEVAGELPPVLGDAGRLQQAWLNYLHNAFEAVRGKGVPGGWVRARVRRDETGRGLVVEIADNGVGMDAETVKSLKESWRGSGVSAGRAGIGTREAARVIAEHGGVVEVQSAPGEGAVVSVRLPAAEGEPS